MINRNFRAVCANWDLAGAGNLPSSAILCESGIPDSGVEHSLQNKYEIYRRYLTIKDDLHDENAIKVKEWIEWALDISNTSFKINKQSNYNKDIYMDSCSICANNDNLESHHINWQKDFVDTIGGQIHKTKSHIIKDSKANLIVLCSKCHDNLHNKNFTISSLQMLQN